MISCIHFIRHGKTEGSEKHWYYGASDVPLLEEAVEHTLGLKAKGIYPEFEDMDFYTTGLGRTEQTLKLIYGDVPHKQIENLREYNFGEFECKTYDELKDRPGFQKWAESYSIGVKPESKEWLESKDANTNTPGGENKRGFIERIGRGLKELRNYHKMKEFSHRHSGKDSHSVMVCHGGVTATCMSLLFPGEREFWDWKPEPGHGFSVAFVNGEPVSWKEF